MNKLLTLILSISLFIPITPPTQRTKAEATQWIENRKTEEWAENYDIFGKTPQCVDLIEYYYDYLVGYRSVGNASTYMNCNLPKGWEYANYPQSGDIAVWDKSKTRKYGHVAIVENVYQGLGMFSYIDVDGLTVEFRHSTVFIESPTTYIRPNLES